MNSYQEDDGIYGVGILDDIHLLFPEILYDTHMFPDDSNRIIGWLRFRIRNLMPQAYLRAKNQYELTRAPRSRAAYNEWLYRVNSPRSEPVRAVYTPNLNSAIFTIDEYHRQPSTRTHNQHSIATLTNSLIEPLESSLLLNVLQDLVIPAAPRTTRLSNNNFTDSFLRRFFESVPINPSEEQITEGSTVLDVTTVSSDEICPVCQEHECFEHPNEPWRKLNHCEHKFHKFCIDNWLTRSPYCPVCRDDIRAASHSNNDDETLPATPPIERDQNSEPTSSDRTSSDQDS